MKKYLALILSLAMVCLLFAGCSGSQTPAASPEPEQAAAPAAEAAPAPEAAPAEEPAPAEEAPAAEPEAPEAEEAAPAEAPAPGPEGPPPEGPGGPPPEGGPGGPPPEGPGGPPPEEPAVEEGPLDAAGMTISDAMTIPTFTYDLPLTDGATFSVYTDSAPPFAMPYLGEDGTFNTAAFTLKIQELTGVKLEYTETDMFTYSEKFQLMIASGSYTDLFTSLANYTAEQAYVDEVILNLTDQVENDMPIRKSLIDAFGLEDYQYNEDGNILSVAGISIGARAPKGLTMRMDWLEAQGLDVPKTYDQLHDAAVALKDAYDLDSAFFLSTTVNPSLALSAGYDVPDFDMTISDASLYIRDREVHCAYVEDNFKDYLMMLGQWFGEGLINHDFYTTIFSDSTNRFRNSEFAFYWDNPNFITEDNTIITLQEPGFRAGAGPFTLKEEGQVLHFTAGQELSLGQGVYITTECDDLDTLISLLDFMFGPEGIMLSNWGIEASSTDSPDGSYYLDEDGNPAYTDYMVNNPDGLPFMTATISFLQNKLPSVMDEHKGDAVSLDEDGQYANDLWLHGFETDGAYDFYGTLYLTEEETTKFNNAMSDVQTTASEFILKAIVNDTDIEAEWDSFVQKLYDMGLQDALDARQAALDRYYERIGE